MEALIVGLDAVRPAAPFTETLKLEGTDGFIEQTIDRESILRVSTPEVMRFEAIDYQAEDSTWFVPLMDGALTGMVEVDPESSRVNTVEEILLMESFLTWQKRIVR
jgi:hypothetical protein